MFFLLNWYSYKYRILYDIVVNYFSIFCYFTAIRLILIQRVDVDILFIEFDLHFYKYVIFIEIISLYNLLRKYANR